MEREKEEKESGTILHERWAVHPVMDCAALQSQRRVRSGHQGFGNVWYAGAYLHYGFHEDGFRSGIEAARGLLKVRYSAGEELKRRRTDYTPHVLA